MYTDRKHLKNNEIKARFDDDTIALIQAIARINRMQPAVLVREVVMAEIRRRLEASPDLIPNGSR